MRKYISVFLMCIGKFIFRFFYRCEVIWIKKGVGDPWKDVRLFVFLNHTSLYEPLFLIGMPYRFFFEAGPKMLAPGADVTLMRPIVGKIFSIIFPGMIPITRKRDDSWNNFLSLIKEDTFVAIAPEGRMKRATGLDKEGKPMSVMGGISDVLKVISKGKMVLAYSGGLHHVQIPGEKLPKIFQTIKINYEVENIEDFIALCETRGEATFKQAVSSELEERMVKNIP